MPVKALFFPVIFLLMPFWSYSLQLSNEAEISVLTCSPGNEAYSVYGHSAIRVTDNLYNYDLVFNYGIFDFNTPDFIYRFASGQTDYLLGAYKFSAFYEEYLIDKRSIFEQVLNISLEEKQKIFDFLIWNAQPENRVYRYNFFFDNCATRIRDVVSQQIDGNVVFPDKPEVQKTFRQLIKDYHSKLLWLNFGIDLVVSAPADRTASVAEEMFLPDYVMKYFAEAVIKSEGVTKPLVKESNVIYQAPELKFKSLGIISPFVILGLLFIIVLFVSVRQYLKGNLTSWPDYLVYGLTGLMGTIMLWFVFFSEHPAMRPNYNLLWAVPLNLVFAIAWKVKKWRPVIKYYHIIITVWLVLVVLSELFIPQKFHAAHYFFILMVLSRSVIHSIFMFKRKF
ncbi:MAG: DUF4105 domain-containing protein [Draconibacterium sp.]